jgi:cytochrome c biogenesis protein CcdA
MTSLVAGIAAAAWLGILTSISPCPLATNIAAVSFLARRMHSRRLAMAGALAYAAGRASIYLMVGWLVWWGLAAAPALSSALQRWVGPFVGPVLIPVGLVLLGWIGLPVDFGFKSEKAAERLAALGVAGEFLLGALFALTFCPVSAALFFGALLPLALSRPDGFALFAVFGVATALPVGVVAILLAAGTKAAGRFVSGIQRGQGMIRAVSGGVILAVGIWLTAKNLLGP